MKPEDLGADVIAVYIKENTALRNEIHRARTDHTYWAQFNTVPSDNECLFSTSVWSDMVAVAQTNARMDLTFDQYTSAGYEATKRITNARAIIAANAVVELAADYLEGLHDYHLHADFETVRVPIARQKRERLVEAIAKVYRA